MEINRYKCGTCGMYYMSSFGVTTVYDVPICNGCRTGYTDEKLKEFINIIENE